MDDLSVDDGVEEGFNISDVWAIVQMQWRVVFAGMVVGAIVAVIATMMATPYYRAKSVVMISTLANMEMEMGESVSNANMVWNRDLYINTRISLFSSRSIRSKILERYEDLGIDDGIGSNGSGQSLLRRSLQISKRKNTELLDITITTPDPELSARLANLTAEVLRDDSLESTTEAALSAKVWLTSQVEEYEQRIRQGSQELLEYQRTNDMAEVEDDTTTLDARMNSLKQAYGAANTERVQQETLVKEHARLLRAGKVDELAKQMASPSVQQLHLAVINEKATFKEFASTYGPKWPNYKVAQQRLDEASALLEGEVRRNLAAERSLLEVFTAREEALNKEIHGGKGQLLDAQSLYADYEKKRLELETTKDFYRQMKERFGELELQSKTQLNNVRIIEEARPSKSPVSPNASFNLMMGVAGGILLGLTLALAREWLDDTISSQLDVTTYLKLPLLGLIPRIEIEVEDEKDRTLHTHFHPKSNLAEAARGLRTVIELNPNVGAPRRLLVTSALSGEGKTSTAVRLAIAYANLGRKVCLVDADLRRPRIHKVLGVEKVPGLSTAIQGERTVRDVVHETFVDNLSFIAAGKGSDRPTEILASVELPGILDELDAMFDIVIIDSPPSALLSDARILSRLVDGVVVMVKEKATSRVVIRDAVRGLQQVGARVLGVVVNEIDLRRQKNNYYYGYSYSYEQYYDDDDAAAK